MQTKRALGLGLSLVLAAAGAISGTGAGADVPPGQVLDNRKFGDSNDPLRGRDIPGLAVDPADPRHIVMIDEDFLAGQCDFHTSFDGGRTWTDGHLTVPPDFADPPCFTFDSGGYAHYNKSVVFGSGQNVYTTFASHRGSQQRPESNVVAGEGDSVIVNRSTDGGKTFERGVVAIEGAKDSRPFIIRPGVAVQPRPEGDRVYAVGWLVNNPPGMGASGGAGDRKTVVAVSEDGGTTWSPPVEAQGPEEKVREIAPPVVAPDGALYIAWRNRDDPATTQPRPIVVAKSTDGGKTFTRTPLGNVGPAPSGIPAPAGSSGYPRMAVDPKTGALYVVYVGFNFGDLDVIFQRSTDGGATWTQPLRVNDDPRGNGVRQLTPQVFVAPNSRVDVIWTDTRATYPSPILPRPAGHADIYYASSTNGGNTFTEGRRISDRSMNLDEGLLGRIGTYTWWGPAAAPIGDDTILFTWGDTRFSNVDTATNDIILATMRLGAPGASITEYESDIGDLSVAASQLAYPGGAERIGAAFTSKLVVVGSGDAEGALAGAVLARANASPLLVVSGNKLTNEQKDELERLHTRGVYVIGDQGSVSDSVVNEITKAGVITAPPPTPPTTVAAPPTTAATPTTVEGAPPTTAAPTTTTTIPTPTAGRSDVVRLTGATPADLAKAVAEAMDVRTAEEKSRPVPAFTAAVVVDPATPEATTAIAFAAANRYPMLFVGPDSVPAATADTFNAMGIQNTWVVGGPGVVPDDIMGRLPGPRRLGGANVKDTTAAVVNESKTRGMPVNVVWVADDAEPVDAAVAGAAVARVGGLLLVNPGADPIVAERDLADLGLTGSVDKIVAVKSNPTSNIPWAILIVSGFLAFAGIALILAARARAIGSRPASAGTGAGAGESERTTPMTTTTTTTPEPDAGP